MTPQSSHVGGASTQTQERLQKVILVKLRWILTPVTPTGSHDSDEDDDLEDLSDMSEDEDEEVEDEDSGLYTNKVQKGTNWWL